MQENLNSDNEEQLDTDDDEVTYGERSSLLQVPQDKHAHQTKKTRVRSGSIIETTVEQPDGTIKMVVGCTHEHSALSEAESIDSDYSRRSRHKNNAKGRAGRRPTSSRSQSSFSSQRNEPLLKLESERRPSKRH